MGWREKEKAADGFLKNSCLSIKIAAFAFSLVRFLVLLPKFRFLFIFCRDSVGESCFYVYFDDWVEKIRTFVVFLVFVEGKMRSFFFFYGSVRFGLGLKIYVSDALKVDGFWVFALFFILGWTEGFWFCGVGSSTLMIRWFWWFLVLFGWSVSCFDSVYWILFGSWFSINGYWLFWLGFWMWVLLIM